MNLNGNPDNRLQQLLDQAFENSHKLNIETFLSNSVMDEFERELDAEFQGDDLEPDSTVEEPVLSSLNTCTADFVMSNKLRLLEAHRFKAAAIFIADALSGKIHDMDCSAFSRELEILENLIFHKNSIIFEDQKNG